MFKRIKPDTIHIYKSDNELRWTRRNGWNKQIVGASSQGYNSNRALMKNIKNTQKEPYVVVDET